MKLHFTYCLVLILSPLLLSAQEKARGFFYLKLSEESAFTTRKPDQPVLELSHPETSREFRKVIPLQKNQPKNRSTKSVLDGLYRIHVDEDTDIDALIDSLSHFSNVVYAEPAYQEELLYIPNDAHLSNGSQSYLEVIKAYEAWDITKGSNEIKIGILDTGTDLDHEDLASKIYQNHHDPVNGVDDDGNGYIDDFEGYDLADNDRVAQADNSVHGALVSGLAGAATDNEIGLSSIGFNTLLVPLKVFKSEDNSSGGNYEAIIYAADNGIDIVNISWGSVDSYSQAAQDIINYAVLEKNVIIVAAAGNQGNEQRYFPASYDHVLSVGATDNSDEKAGFSTYNYAVDILAPGTNILSTTTNNNYSRDSGTSYSTPLVSGAAALVKDHYPNLNAVQLMELLRVTADDIYHVGNNIAFDGKLGKGRLNVLRALSDRPVKAVRAQNLQYHNGRGQLAYHGDTISFSSDIVNYLSSLTDARIRLSTSSEYAQLLMEDIHIGKLDTLDSLSFGEKVLLLNEDTPPDTEIAIRLDYADDQYEDFQYLVFQTEPDYADVGNNHLKLTVAANGNLGYADDEAQNGIGIEWNGKPVAANVSFLVSGPAGQVSDNLPYVPKGQIREADFSTHKHLKLSRSLTSGQMAQSSFSDEHAPTPIGLIVDQRTFAFDDKDFLILEYRLINNTADSIKHLSAGLYLDWDLNAALQNRSAYDAQNNILLTYSKDHDDYAGLKTFFDPLPVYQALDLLDLDGNSIDLNDSIGDQQKHLLATEQRYDSAGIFGDGNDVADLLAQDSVTIPPFQSRKVAFFIALAGDHEELVSSLQDADSTYRKILTKPPLLETFTSCKGASLKVDPQKDSLFRFYSDPYAKNLIGEGSSVFVGPVSQDTSVYVVNVGTTYESEIQRLDIILIDNVADFSMSTDTLFLDDPQVNQVTFRDQSFMADYWRWNFDNGVKATIQNPRVNFTQPGIYEISLYVENSLGCADEVTRQLLVVNRPEIPAIEDALICKNEPFILKASNTDSIAIYHHEGDLLPVLETTDTTIFDMITTDTCFYATNIEGPFESLKTKICVRVEHSPAAFAYAPDTASSENKALFTNTSADPFASSWYVDNRLAGTESGISVEITKEEYTLALVNESRLGCRDSVGIQLRLQPSPVPVTTDMVTCIGRDVLITPSNGQVFAFYADPALDSLIKKGKSLRIDSISENLSIFVSGLDSLLPSPAVELTIRPEKLDFSIAASPDTLLLAEGRTARFEANTDSLVTWAWFKNGTFQESLANPVLFFDSAAVYEMVLRAETIRGCQVADTLHYHVADTEVVTPLEASDNETVVFPNPSNGILTIYNIPYDAEVAIRDLAGKEIRRLKTTSRLLQLDLTGEKPGIYILQLSHHTRSISRKIQLE